MTFSPYIRTPSNEESSRCLLLHTITDFNADDLLSMLGSTTVLIPVTRKTSFERLMACDKTVVEAGFGCALRAAATREQRRELRLEAGVFAVPQRPLEDGELLD